jgi:hypothetical protein
MVPYLRTVSFVVNRIMQDIGCRCVSVGSHYSESCQ